MSLTIRVYYNCEASKEETIATYHNAVLIYNPFARGLHGKRAERLERALDILRSAGHSVTAVTTTGPQTAGDLARRCLGGGTDLILVAGGDGTINEVLNGVVPAEAPIGILPAGTANVLASELGVPCDIEKAARQLEQWAPRRIPVGLLHTDGGAVARYFLLMAGAGFDARIVYKLHPDLKKLHGKLSYWITGFGELGRKLEEFDAMIGGRSFRCSFVLASRVRNYGGTVEIASHASLFSNDFEVVLVSGTNPIRYLKYLAGVLTGRLGRMKGITMLRAQRMEFACGAAEHIRVQVDGEVAGSLPASVEIVPDALTLLVPKDFKG